MDAPLSDLNPLPPEQPTHAVPPDSSSYWDYPPPPRRKRGPRWWVFGLGFASIFSMLGCCICLLILAPAVWGETQADGIQPAIEAFLEAMDQKDLDAAYQMISAQGRWQISRDSLEALTTGANYSVIEGFESVEITDMAVQNGISNDPNVPSGVFAEVSAIINFEDGYTGSFDGIVVQEDDQWRIFSFNVNVPPEKIQHSSNR